MEMIKEKSWKTFQDAGMFWMTNRILQVFGWSLVMEIGEEEDIIGVYPARNKFRGFCEKSETKGFQKVTQFLSDNITELLAETKDE
jgi:hypothetical protein